MAIYLCSALGLRMSHFNEGREGVAADPKQRTLSNFLVADHASGRELGAQAQPESTSSDDALAIGRDSSLCSDIYEPSESIDFVGTHQIPDSEHSGSRNFHNEAETQGISDHGTVRFATNLLQTRESSSGIFEESSFDQTKRIFWLNDYQCSVCGVELPPSFVEERQEHFDFHLAERLQHEESSNGNRLVNSNLR